VTFVAISHWQKEFESWTDMNTIVYLGTSEARNMIRQYEFFYRDGKDRIPKFNVLITTFEMITQDCSVLQPIDWTALVVDEAHRLKNKVCWLYKHQNPGSSFKHTEL
jgi:SNF2 family DNA or RNA helicase